MHCLNQCKANSNNSEKEFSRVTGWAPHLAWFLMHSMILFSYKKADLFSRRYVFFKWGLYYSSLSICFTSCRLLLNTLHQKATSSLVCPGLYSSSLTGRLTNTLVNTGLFINNEFVAGANTIDTINPSTGKVITAVQAGMFGFPPKTYICTTITNTHLSREGASWSCRRCCWEGVSKLAPC